MFLSFLAASYVPYDPAIFVKLWGAIMVTIQTAVAVGFPIFIVFSCIGIFKVVIRLFF